MSLDKLDFDAKGEQSKNSVKFIAEILVVIILAIVVASVINGAVFVTTRVSGASMNNTLYGGGNSSVEDGTSFDKFFFGGADNYGDKVVMVRTQKVKYGDIVVFKLEGQQLIKRVIAVGGDTIKIVNHVVYVNGVALDETYIIGTTNPANTTEITVPQGQMFVMGDNRENSTDSRVFGAVSTSCIVGRVFLVIKKDTKKLVWVKSLS